MKEANLPEPVFLNEREDFVVTFYNGEYPELYPERISLDKKIPDKRTSDIKTNNFNKILKLCETPRSITEIMEEFNYKSKKTLKRNYIKPLLEQGKLKMTIPDKPTSRNQKYITVIQ